MNLENKLLTLLVAMEKLQYHNYKSIEDFDAGFSEMMSVKDSILHELSTECVTIPTYWDCECEKDFIHPKTEKICIKCNCSEDTQPDSRLNEVVAHLWYENFQQRV